MVDNPARLLLIRHAHVDTGMPPGRLCGSLDLPLSRTGWEQIQRVIRRMPAEDAPQALYTSPLTRARETAVALGRLWRLEPHVENALAEIHCGQLEGMPIRRIERQYPEVWAQNLAQNDDRFTWPGGESYRQFRERVIAVLRAIAARHAGRRIAVVTHAGVVAQVMGSIDGRSAAVWELDRPAPLSGTEVTWANGSPQRVLRFNARKWW
jgi:broad specificity phosphatase PhoE